MNKDLPPKTRSERDDYNDDIIVIEKSVVSLNALILAPHQPRYLPF
jgi:hypothetical protein